jgi:hypothetical protein
MAKRIRYSQRLEDEVRKRVPNDLKDHQITQLLDSGPYRHWRCRKPGTIVLGFDVITWPGFICITGDMGEFLFSRTYDMLEFCRRSCKSYGYMHEKLQAVDVRTGAEEFRREAFEDALRDRLRGELENYKEGFVSREDVEVVRDKIAEVREASEYGMGGERESIQAMYESELWDSGDLPSCQSFTFHFMWILHAIQWFCDRTPPRESYPEFDNGKLPRE